METAVIACRTLEDELLHAFSLTDRQPEIYWIESGLHNYPNRLRTHLQEVLDSLGNCNQVLMAFGNCGNAVIGLRSGNFEMIIPRVDDCISMLIGSMKRRLEINREGGTYFLTPGWLRGERNLYVEYEYTLDKYGKETADEVMRSMLAHYKYLGLLDTGAYDVTSIMPTINTVAERLHLREKMIPASVDYLIRLLEGPWDAECFVVTPPYTTLDSFTFNNIEATPLQ